MSDSVWIRFHLRCELCGHELFYRSTDRAYVHLSADYSVNGGDRKPCPNSGKEYRVLNPATVEEI